MAAEKLLTTREAAEFLGVQEQTVRRWRSSGQVRLPFVRVGRNVRYRPEALKRWLERNEQLRG